MRLEETAKIINDNVPTLYNVSGVDLNSGGRRYKQIKNFGEIKQAILNLLDTGLYNQEQTILEKHMFLPAVSNDILQLDEKEYTVFIDALSRIIYKSTAITDLITRNLPEEDKPDSTLVISLPSTDLDFQEFYSIIERLNKSFLVLKNVNLFRDSFNVDSFDVGSMWIILAMATPAAVAAIGGLVAIVQNARIENRQLHAQDKFLESLDLDEGIKNKVKAAEVAHYQQINRKLAQQFVDENNIEDQGEILTQMSKVTENIDRLLEVGVGFEAGIKSANEIAKTFPKLNEQKALSQSFKIESLKKLENNDDSK